MIYINQDNPQPRLINQVVERLRKGAVICYPTDTVYGIGCDIFNQKAIKRIYQLKRQPKEKPFSFMCASLKDVSTFCHMSNYAYRLMKQYLPGPYTFILPTMKIVPKIMTSHQKTVGIRVPDNTICQALIASTGWTSMMTLRVRLSRTQSAQPTSIATKSATLAQSGSRQARKNPMHIIRISLRELRMLSPEYPRAIVASR